MNKTKMGKKPSESKDKKGIRVLKTKATSTLESLFIPRTFTNNFLGRFFHPKLKVAHIEITNNCNMRCKMCIYTQQKQKTGYISKSLFESCVNQLSQIGVETLYLHFGGESLVHPGFKDFLRYAISQRKKGKIANVSWIDNGMLFDQTISDLVVDLQVDSIAFSLDGVGDVNDKIRLGSNYSVIEKNIKYLIERRGNAKKPNIVLSMCDYGKTEEQKLDVYREWIPFVDSITLIPSIKPDNTWENKDENSQKLRMIKPPAFCLFPFETMAVSWDGKVTGCCLDYIFKMELGDATKESLKQIWQGPRYQAFRKAALKNVFPIGSPCHKCEFWQINFEPRQDLILDEKAAIKYGYIYRRIERNV